MSSGATTAVGGIHAARPISPKVLKAAATALQDCIDKSAWEHVDLLRALYLETEQRDFAPDNS